jgi:hypothetical protein
MGNVYPSDHPSDGDLLEQHLAGEVDPHLAGCARCAARADAIARALDAFPDDAAEARFDDRFYRRQAARIGARIADGEGHATRGRRALTRALLMGGSMAAVVTLAVALHDRVPMRHGIPADDQAFAQAGFASAQDAADDRLLRSIDDTLDEDSYDFAPQEG